eukprot:TRINITY_DN337_c3_g1_i1.p1 TRINITY_DN337_c3_g1~~TRINITY_DN337_c3_g1_i1.p1  ORF type:complete len:512 (+),score=141.51 TRINITY_DN337_c3_g1_i1:48-1538(+)
MVKIKLKHEKSRHEVDVNVDGTVAELRDHIFKLTGVPIERQKIVIKGKELKDADSLKEKITPNLVAMLMGSAEAVPEKPAEIAKFIEDIAGVSTLEISPPGLSNLDNTCYLNATVQILRVIPEFVAKLNELPATSPTASEEGVMTALKSVYKEMEKHADGSPVSPILFVMLTRTFWPQFDQKDRGHYAQQDAEEYANQLLSAAANVMKTAGGERNLIADLFDGRLEETAKNIEDKEEVTKSEAAFRVLRCPLDTDIATVEAGLERTMTQHIEKNSAKLGRNAQWELSQRLDSLPPYLLINIVRFEWRKDVNARTKKLRRIAIPDNLDVYTLCSDGLKQRLDPTREKCKEERDAAMEAKRRDKQENRMAGKKKEEEKKEEEKKDETKDDEKEKEGGQTPMEVDDPSTAPAVEEKPANDNGYYELCGIVTHRGRTADSGHYIGWRKQKNGKWLCLDDEKVYEVPDDKIKELAGGGESDGAYLLLYRMKDENGKLAAMW